MKVLRQELGLLALLFMLQAQSALFVPM